MTDAAGDIEPRLGNKLICPECGEVRLETPPGTTILPTLGMAKKASGAAGPCSCGRRPGERPTPVPAGTVTPVRSEPLRGAHEQTPPESAATDQE